MNGRILDVWEVFRGIIAKEMELFNQEAKRNGPTGVFCTIANDIWLYYIKMSSVTLTQVLDCGIISDVTERESATCACSTHDEHQSYSQASADFLFTLSTICY